MNWVFCISAKGKETEQFIGICTWLLQMELRVRILKFISDGVPYDYDEVYTAMCEVKLGKTSDLHSIEDVNNNSYVKYPNDFGEVFEKLRTEGYITILN